MGQYGALVAMEMVVTAHEFLWVGAYVSCGCTTSYDTPFSMFQYRRGLEH